MCIQRALAARCSKYGFSRKNLCTLHSVPGCAMLKMLDFLGTACPGCAMLKMLDFLGKSLHFAQRALESRRSKCWIFREISALCTACPGIEMLNMLDFLREISALLHSVSWLRDAQNARFSREISAPAQLALESRCSKCWISREISALCTACRGCAMLKMQNFLGNSLLFAQHVLAARCSKCWIF